ncbi:MAG TPA: hypothetical protein VMB50_23860 [Myxococcales bacterium]|nr:hypothetical protein [Myxococcales bacterium]
MAALLTMAVLASAATAAGVKVCIPSKEGKPIITPKAGVCKTGYTMTEFGGAGEGKEGKEGPPGKEGAPGKEGPPGKEGKEGKQGKQGPEGKVPFTEEEQATLKAILPYIKFVSAGVGGKPTIQFSGANVQVLSGAGNQGILNGVGNLVVGYNSPAGTQTGSNNIVVGSGQSYTSFGALLAGNFNTASSQENVVFGAKNIASGKYAAVTGGEQNTASGQESLVAGGISNEATTNQATVAGGVGNQALEIWSFVGGGNHNKASALASSVFGSSLSVASGENAAVFGGKEDEASGKFSAVLGGHGVKVTTEFGHTP